MPETVKFNPQALLDQYLGSDKASNYYDLLMKLNQGVNLVSRETKRTDFDRLAAESLLPLAFLPKKMNGYLDIGSGGGFPAVPILLSGAIDGACLLVERTGKKARALEQIVAGLSLRANVLSQTFEDLGGETSPVELITLRYVKLTKSLLRRIMFRLAPGGRLVYYSTPDFDTSGTTSVSHQFESPQDSVVKSFTIFSR